MWSPPIDFDKRWGREDRAERHGHTLEEAHELYRRAAQSASCCGDCGQALTPVDSVTVVWRQIGGVARWGTDHYRRVPICLLCTLDLFNNQFYRPSWHRTRCLNCGRPIRIEGHSLNARSCCADCQRAARNKRNALRRRVKHAPKRCAYCGERFIPKRADAITCSNRCRQGLHRVTGETAASDSRYARRRKREREAAR